MAEKDKDSATALAAANAPTKATLAQAPAGPSVVVQTAPPPPQTAQDLGRPEGWKHDQVDPKVGARFIVNGVAVDADGKPHRDKATRREVEDSYRAKGLTPPPEEGPTP